MNDDDDKQPGHGHAQHPPPPESPELASRRRFLARRASR